MKAPSRFRIGVTWLSFVALGCCGAFAGQADLLPRFSFLGNGFSVCEWLVMGPFGGVEEIDLLDEDHLREFALSETANDARAFENGILALRTDVGRAGEVPSRNRAQGDILDFVNLFGQPYTAAPRACVYAACEITAAVEGRVVLLAGSGGMAKAWVNGQLVIDVPAHRAIATFDDAVPISLRRGSNLIVFKVARTGVGWGLAARIEPSEEAAASTALERHSMLESLLLPQCIIKPGEALEFAPRGVLKGFECPARVRRLSGVIVAETTLAAGTGKWIPDTSVGAGVYEMSIQVGGKDYVQPFVIGDAAGIGAALLARGRKFAADERVGWTMDAIERRLAVAYTPKNLRTLVHTLVDLERTVLRLERGEQVFQGVAGLHLRAFRSEIDDQVQHYRLFVPSTYRPDGPALPLVVMVPTVLSANRPFIESPFMAAHSEADRMSVIAERLGLAVVWSGYRNRPTGQECEFTHLDEVLRAVGRDYRIDPERVFLCGACSGGAISTMAAVRWPERFAAIGLLNPVFKLGKSLSPEDMLPFFRSEGFREWIVRDNNVLDRFFGPNGTPVHIVHDGAQPGHGDLAVSLDFVARAKVAHHPHSFVQMPQTLHQHFGAWEHMLEWFAAQRREHTSKRRVDLTKKSPGETGPISNAFSRRFVVVKGTRGTAADTTELDRVTQEFRDAWRGTHFGKCVTVSDREFEASRFADSNLVLIGNAETNTVWRELVGSLQCSISPHEVRVGDRSWTGRDLAIQAVVRNLANPDRLIVLLGSSNPAKLRFGTLDLSVKGWFSYAVWANDGEKPKLVDAGMW